MMPLIMMKDPQICVVRICTPIGATTLRIEPTVLRVCGRQVAGSPFSRARANSRNSSRYDLLRPKMKGERVNRFDVREKNKKKYG